MGGLLREAVVNHLGTFKSTRDGLTTNILPCFGHLPVRDVRPKDVLAVVRRLEQRGL